MDTGPSPSVHIAPADLLPSEWPSGPRVGWTASMPPLSATPHYEDSADSLGIVRSAASSVLWDRPTADACPIHLEPGPPWSLTATFHDLLRIAQELKETTPGGEGLASAIREAIPAVSTPSSIVTSRGGLRFDGQPLLMGVVNVTPDSFSDGGLHLEGGAARQRAWELVEEGADLIDMGAESTRPGAEPVQADEELRRLLPALKALAPDCPVPISVDTYKAAVAQVALQEGADLINDISGLTFDPFLAEVVARNEAPLVLVHTLGRPKTMQHDPRYRWLVGDVVEGLAESVKRAGEAGISPERCLIDPGLGFGKTFAHNEQLIEALPILRGLGHPVVVGPSRKAFIRARWGEGREGLIRGTAEVCRRAASLGASVLRVHDVGDVRQALIIEGPGAYPARHE
jgi:dihydropteroate synthase